MQVISRPQLEKRCCVASSPNFDMAYNVAPPALQPHCLRHAPRVRLRHAPRVRLRHTSYAPEMLSHLGFRI